MRGNASVTLQLVVAKDKQAAREAFASQLNDELDRIGVPPGRPRISDVHRRLRKDGKSLVSREQVRKWVRGKDIPDQANLRIVVERLNLEWTRLQPGAAAPEASHLYLRLQAAWEALTNDTARQALIDYALYLGAKDGAATKARPEGSVSEGERASLQRSRRV